MNTTTDTKGLPWNPDYTALPALQKAIAAAQAEMANPTFDSQNPHFRNRFASLAAVRNAVVPVFAKHGVAVLQDLTTVDGGVACTTVLAGFGAEIRFGPLVMPAQKPDAQGRGSAATYARRYALMAVANVVGDEDDDANAASGTEKTEHTQADPRGDAREQADRKKVTRCQQAITKAVKEDDAKQVREVLEWLEPHQAEWIVVWDLLQKREKEYCDLVWDEVVRERRKEEAA